jgi:hypothetical protein
LRCGELDPLAWGYRGRPRALINDMFEGALALLGPLRPIQIAQLRLRTIEYLRELGYLPADWPVTLEGSESALDVVDDDERRWRTISGKAAGPPPRRNAEPHASRETSAGLKFGKSEVRTNASDLKSENTSDAIASAETADLRAAEPAP